MSLQNNLFGGVESIVDRVIESTPIDLTITAEVILLKNADIGEYKVKYKGDTFSAKALDPSAVYRKTEEVYVLVPKGDFSASKVILGKAAFNDNVTYTDRQTMSNQWKTRGPNWLSDQWYWKNSSGQYRSDNLSREAGIIATTIGQENLITGGAGSPPSWREYIFNRTADKVPQPDEPQLSPARVDKTTFPKAANTPSLKALEKADKDFQSYANTFDHIMIKADFETNFSMTHFSGQYGVLVECWNTNPKFGKENYPDEPEKILVTFRFSFADFNGAPYQFNQATPQQAVFPVPKGTLKGLVRVSLFQDDGWNTDIVPAYIKGVSPEVSYDPAKGAIPVRDRNNILTKNIDIRFCEPMNLQESLFWLRIDAPKGTTLYNPTGTVPGNTTLPLEARLFYGSEEVTSKETCKFIWFRQKYSATMDKVDKDKDMDEFGRSWFDYGDNGWAPVDRIMQTPAADPVFGEDDPSFTNKYSFKDPLWQQTLNVGIDNVSWQWRYKVVCIYNPTSRADDSKVIRERREVKLSEIETIVNTSSIHNFELPLPEVSDDLLATLLRVKNNSLPWVEGTAFNPQKPEDPDPAKDWWCRWWMETPSGLYEPVPHTGIPRFQKGKIRINDYLQYDAITFKAQIFGKRNPDGLTDAEKVADAAKVWSWPSGPDQTKEHNEFEIANIERTLLRSDDLLLLVDWDGVLNHSYNSDGSVLLQSSVGSDFHLRAILHWADSNIMDYSIEWIAPDGITPLKHHSSYIGGAVVGTGFNLEDSMMQDMWVGADNIVHYRTRQKYDMNKTKNTYTLRIILMDGRIFEYRKEIAFVKAGQNGTQGSDWEARIWPTNGVAEGNPSGGTGFERYTEEIRKYPRPLVIDGNFDGTGPLNRNPNYQLLLRPFIYKNGKRIEELADRDKYSYKVYWDTRYPNLKNKALVDRYAARNGSFLKLVKFNGRSPIDFGGKTPGPTSPLNISDMQAYTTSADTLGGAVAGHRTYGALEVQWRGLNTCGTGATISGLKYDTVVKAQVDIYYQDADGVDTLTASIFSYWPVDLVFTNGASLTPTTFNPNLVNTNWPQFVLYNASGYAPETPQEHLRFFYGEKAWRNFDPMPFTATPVNLTTGIQTISRETTKDLKSWRLYPRPYYFYEECANGSIRTDFTTDTGDIGWANPNPDMVGWQGCTYVRPIVYSINYFGNTDINGWDGKSIDLNSERGTIFAPTVGAGYKDPLSNKFNGVIMGIDTSQSKQVYENIFGGFSADDIKKRPYMTGIFGYQDGASSFGIMENGTAYFGRADRGGRIIIDGYNAQIYGGLATDTKPGNGGASGSLDMNMHNRMRLSFIDFAGVNYQEVSPTNDRSSLSTDGIKINTGAWDVKAFNDYFCAEPLEKGTLRALNAGFGSGRGAGTPAIEIGSYGDYMKEKPGNRGIDLIKRISTLEAKEKFKGLEDLEIPGFRKFLVTYDGTLYAMNCFIKGNIVGSNIVASNYFNNAGSFWVTEEGNMGVGTPGRPFGERFVKNFGSWSVNPPEEEASEKTVAEIIRSGPSWWTNIPYDPSPTGKHEVAIKQYEGADSPFFISSDGRVFCREIHISGDSSINIGGFHVLSKTATGKNKGDVFSFGTMYLVGPSAGTGTWGTGGTAVEAWGDFYLRGRLTNLGPVFLGSSFEKSIEGGGHEATSQNSPFSITPATGTPGRWLDDPAFPVQGSFWPLYFHNQEKWSTTKNTSWVTLSGDDNRYMPEFNLRVKRFFKTSDTTLPREITWRVDQLGAWTDGTLFTNKDWLNMTDLTDLKLESHALAYYGWWKTAANEGTPIDGFMLKNFSSNAPSMMIETSDHLHISTGRREMNVDGNKVRPPSPRTGPSKIIIEAFHNYTPATRNQHGPVLSLISRDTNLSDSSDVGSLAAGTISLTGRNPNRSNNKKDSINSFIFLNAFGFKTSTGIEITDEKGNIVDALPSGPAAVATDYGRIWIKGLGVAVDAAYGAANVTTNEAIASVRVCRSWDGTNGAGRPGMSAGTYGETSVNIRANDVQIRANDSSRWPSGAPGKGNIHIYNINDCNNAAANEVFLDRDGKALRMTGAENLSIGIRNAGHSAPTIGMTMQYGQLRVVGFTAEQQFGIYARFA